MESCRSLDVNRLQKAGYLSPGWSGGWQWTRDGEKVAWISLRAGASRLNLTYRVRVSGGEWQDVEETVRIVCIPCRFGGARPYFICPGVVNGITCGRRVAKLANEYRAFVSALVAEHLPQGPTEEHLVEELAGTSLFALPFSTPSRSAEISLLVVSHLCFGRKRVPSNANLFCKAPEAIRELQLWRKRSRDFHTWGARIA
jgi:hypothetical protein